MSDLDSGIPVIQVEEIEEGQYDLGEETIKISSGSLSSVSDKKGSSNVNGSSSKAQPGSDKTDEGITTNNANAFYLTEEEIESAFKFYSGDGKRITREDLRAKLDLICPQLTLKDYKLFFGGTAGFKHGGASSVAGGSALPGASQNASFMVGGGPNTATDINSGKVGKVKFGGTSIGDGDPSQDMVGLRELKNLLLNKDLSSLQPMEEAFRLMDVDESTGAISTSSLKRMLRKMNRHGFTYKHDYDDCLKLFDSDQDGHIGFEDYKKIKAFSKRQ